MLTPHTLIEGCGACLNELSIGLGRVVGMVEEKMFGGKMKRGKTRIRILDDTNRLHLKRAIF